jgi:capsular polysaccharide biosynthesis protein
LYGKKVEEARIASGMDKEQLSNIATIEQPYISSDSDLKKRAATVLLAAVVGLLLGLAAAIGLALFNSSLRMEEDIEHYLRLPVLAVIPDLPRSVSS